MSYYSTWAMLRTRRCTRAISSTALISFSPSLLHRHSNRPIEFSKTLLLTPLPVDTFWNISLYVSRWSWSLLSAWTRKLPGMSLFPGTTKSYCMSARWHAVRPLSGVFHCLQLMMTFYTVKSCVRIQSYARLWISGLHKSLQHSATSVAVSNSHYLTTVPFNMRLVPPTIPNSKFLL